jgi:hypothetical protein
MKPLKDCTTSLTPVALFEKKPPSFHPAASISLTVIAVPGCTVQSV